MPTMYQIYDNHAKEYDELVAHEDYQGNLKTTLHELADFSNCEVIEFGSGTGRLTRLFAEKAKSVRCYDRSPHMMGAAKRRLAEFVDKVSYEVFDHWHADTLQEPADIVIEGWAFGHTAFDHHAELPRAVDQLVTSSRRLVRPGGTLLFIESLGTNTDEPAAPGEVLSEFYRLLEETHGFQRHVVPTPYRFDSLPEAERIMGFFFGQPMAETVRARGQLIVPEFSGIWLQHR